MSGARGRTMAGRIAMVSAAGGVAITVAVATGAGWTVERWGLAARGLGWIALAALVLARAASPVEGIAARVTARAARVPFGALRRAFGITSALAALVHAVLSASAFVAPAWVTLVTWPHLRFGLSALAILCALAVTSFASVLRVLRLRLWKPLHRASYAAGALALLHLLSAPAAPRVTVLALFGALLALRVVALVARRPTDATSVPEP